MTLFQGKGLTQHFGATQLPRLGKIIENIVAQYPSMKDVLFNEVSIDNTDIYQATTLSGISGPEIRQLGVAPTFDTIKQGFATTITVDDRSKGFAIAEETIKDTKINFVERAMEFFMKGAYEEKEFNLAGVFDDAFTVNLADGVPLCDTSHTLESQTGAVNSNLGTAAAFSKTSFQALRNIMQNQVDEQGNKINPMAAFLIYPQAIQDTVKEVLGSEYDPDNANNTINTMYGFTNVLPTGVGFWPYLASTTAFFMAQPKQYTNLHYVNREAYNVVYDYEKHARVHTYSSHERYGIGVPSHRGIVGNAGA